MILVGNVMQQAKHKVEIKNRAIIFLGILVKLQKYYVIEF